jgi:hypothetical protein
VASLTDIREGLAANLRAVLTSVQVVPYMLSSPTPPTVHLYPGGGTELIEYDLAFGRGLDRWSFTVQAFVGTSSDQGAQMKLDEFIASSGPQSVKAAVESDQTLAGALTINPGESPVRVISCSGYRLFAREGNSPVLGAEWNVEVLATGT